MDARLQRRVQRYGWDRAAAVYDQHWQPLLRPAHDRLLDRLRPVRGERALDVACGTGFLTLRLAEAVGDGGHVVATDLSGAMVHATTAAAERSGFANVTVRRAGAETLDVADAAFDVCACAFGLMFVPDPAAALAEMRRALTPDGRLGIAVWGERARCAWAEVFPIVERHVASDVCPLFFGLGTGDRLERLCEEAGFRDIECERIGIDLAFEDDRAVAEAFIEGSAVALAYAGFDDDRKAAVERDFLASVETHREGAGYVIPAEFVLATACR